MSDDCADELREDLPAEVYAAHAPYVRVAMKKMTARRMVGWLREYAEYADISGGPKTAEHARSVANQLASELPEEDVIPVEPRPDTEGGDADD